MRELCSGRFVTPRLFSFYFHLKISPTIYFFVSVVRHIRFSILIHLSNIASTFIETFVLLVSKAASPYGSCFIYSLISEGISSTSCEFTGILATLLTESAYLYFGDSCLTIISAAVVWIDSWSHFSQSPSPFGSWLFSYPLISEGISSTSCEFTGILATLMTESAYL